MKRIVALLLALTLVFGLTACGNQQGSQKAAVTAATQSEKLKLTDLKGRSIELEKIPQRIVSLSPANTEILFALGAGDRVVGVTSYCDYPEQVKNVEKIGTFEGPNIELIKKAKPDVVLAGGYIQEDMIKSLEDLGIPVVSTEAADFNSIFDSIKLIGKITGTESKAEEIVTDMNKRIAAIKDSTKGKPAVKVFYIVWHDPLTTAGAGTFIDDIIKTAGGINLGNKVQGWTKYSAEQLIKDNPEMLIAAKYSTDNGITTEYFASNEIYKKLDCVKNGKVYIMSDDNVVSRPGPRIVEAIEEMAKAIQGNK